MSITLDTTFTNDALPVVTPLGQRILALASCTNWFQAERAAVNLATALVTQWNDRKGGAANFAQAVSDRQATLRDAQVNGYTAAQFDGTDRYAWAGTSEPALTSPFAWAVLFRVDPTLADRGYLLGKFTSSGANTLTALSVSPTGIPQIRHGNGTINDAVAATDVWRLAIAASDGTNLRLRVDGVTATPTTTNNTPGTTNALCLGAATADGLQPFKGDIADVLMFNADILATANAATLGLVENFFTRTYGLTFTPAPLV